jgi:hypothetical protein
VSTTDTPTPPRRGRTRRALLVTGALAAVAVSLPALGDATPARAATTPVVSEHGLGATTPAGYLAARPLARGHAAPALPASVDLTPFALPAGDQGRTNACVAWSEAYTLAGWESNYQQHIGAPFAPYYVYNQINGGRDAGASIGSGLSLMQNQGVAEAAFWAPALYDWKTQPTDAERANAALHKFGSYQLLFSGANQGTAAQAALQTSLASNTPVEIGIPVFGAFFNLNSTNQVMTAAMAASSGYAGRHAIVALGYDATGVRIENSWGRGWGANGFATLSWDFVNKYVDEAYGSTGFLPSSTQAAAALLPVVTALSRPAAGATGGDTLVVTAGRLTSVDPNAANAVTFVNTSDSSVRIPATAVTLTSPSTLSVTVPAVPRDGTYRVVLAGSAGNSAPNGTTDVLALLHPYAVTVATDTIARTPGGTPVTVIGAGFGTTAAQFTANKITATVSGKTVPLAWKGDNQLQVVMPAGVSGVTQPLVVLRNGVASPAVNVSYLPPTPIVTVRTPRASTAGGDTVQVALVNGATVPAPTTVKLVQVSDPSVTLTANVTAQSATALSITMPAAPTDTSGAPLQTAFRVVVTGTGGASLANGTADQVTYRTPITATAATSAPVSAAGGTKVLLTGSGFGATSAAYGQSAITATVNGIGTAISWVDATHLMLTVPAGPAGSIPTVVLKHDTVPGAPFSGPRYAAVITGNSAPAGSSAGGWQSTINGTALNGSSGWALVDSTGTTVATLPVVGSQGSLDASSAGVFISSPTAARVKLPAAPAGKQGVYTLVFTPNASLYPNATLAFTSRAVISYADLG